eukprot:CAMPEP_0197888228 /NCGR_PEP_ID=MMETSP1439-20131203/21687_1 /TAXON_ID=66791 /ORGANISM="Gonyaulax spinifera, Strain CCMP409" /LENGTH=113 /DNA_ID=CAMNT_0043508129 /DNA_START=62 /DNA_END=403 /DNA_ORIENTATION=-
MPAVRLVVVFASALWAVTADPGAATVAKAAVGSTSAGRSTRTADKEQGTSVASASLEEKEGEESPLNNPEDLSVAVLIGAAATADLVRYVRARCSSSAREQAEYLSLPSSPAV